MPFLVRKKCEEKESQYLHIYIAHNVNQQLNMSNGRKNRSNTGQFVYFSLLYPLYLSF